METKRIKALISGRVQGVALRFYTQGVVDQVEDDRPPKVHVRADPPMLPIGLAVVVNPFPPVRPVDVLTEEGLSCSVRKAASRVETLEALHSPRTGV